MPPSAWMPHASGLAGNSAIPLVSQGGKNNDNFSGLMAPTAHLAHASYTRQVMASWGEVLARSRFMKLTAGSEIPEHVDFNYHWYSRVRIHIPVITNTKVNFRCDTQSIHMQPGDSWIFDSWRRHSVTNDSDMDRVHLVIDLAGSARFWQMVRRCESRMGESQGEEKLIGWVPNETPEFRCEKFNVSPVMAPGELDALVKDLVVDFEKSSANPPALLASYRNLLLDFSRDWRELWSQYGYEEKGIEQYRGLIETLKGKLHPQRRALVTSSNDLGVNPIIIQRILSAALAPEELAAFSPTDPL